MTEANPQSGYGSGGSDRAPPYFEAVQPQGTNRVPVVHQASAGAANEGERAVAEVVQEIVSAKRFPRDETRASELIERDCERTTVAENAVYDYAKAGTAITGPSIKLVETIARRWGNISSGWKIIPTAPTYSEIRVWARDNETGTIDSREFPVEHWRDTKGGGYPIRDKREIYELCANMAQRRKRQCLLTVLPSDIVEDAVLRCERTLKAKADTSPEGLAKIVEAFAEFGVTRAQIEARIQRKLDSITPAQVVSLKRVYASLRDAVGTVGEFFAPDPAATAATAAAAEAETAAEPVTGVQKAKEAIRARGKGKTSTAPEKAPTAPPDASAVPSELELTGGGDDPDGPSPEQFRDWMMKAKDRESALLVIDQARGVLEADAYDALVDLLEQRFPDETNLDGGTQ